MTGIRSCTAAVTAFGAVVRIAKEHALGGKPCWSLPPGSTLTTYESELCLAVMIGQIWVCLLREGCLTGQRHACELRSFLRLISAQVFFHLSEAALYPPLYPPLRTVV